MRYSFVRVLQASTSVEALEVLQQQMPESLQKYCSGMSVQQVLIFCVIANNQLNCSLAFLPISSLSFTPAVEELVQAIQAQGLQSIGVVWASQGPEATAAQLHQLGEANAAALFAQLGPDAIASLLRSCGPDFGAQLFLALGAPFAGGLLRHAGTEFSAGLFAALGLDAMVPMLQFMGAEYLSQMMNAAGPATAAGTFKVGVLAHACCESLCWQYVQRCKCSDVRCPAMLPCAVSHLVTETAHRL
jgi:hypothetical protein